MSANALHAGCAEQAEPMGFASMMTIGEKAVMQGNKHCNKEKGKKRAGVAAASIGVDV